MYISNMNDVDTAEIVSLAYAASAVLALSTYDINVGDIVGEITWLKKAVFDICQGAWANFVAPQDW